MNDLRTSADMRRPRIFWLGMHRILVRTELARLRALGYEVFAPPYLSDVVDQSAATDWSWPVTSTLPVEALAKLATCNFFYSNIPTDIAEILNTFFDFAIVTINPDWLIEFLKAYKGPVIYRVYGQPYSLSHHFVTNRAVGLIDERDNFWFVPHLQQTTTIEDTWLKDRMRIVPYSLYEDVFEFQDTWNEDNTNKDIGLLCPRIDNPYYENSYKYIKKYFRKSHFPIFGIQLHQIADSQVVGTLERRKLLERFSHLAGFVYHYKEPAVVYLPPLEMMVIGGPVVHFPQSLLGRLFPKDAPGAAEDEDEARRLAERLRRKDRPLIAEIVASQAPVRIMYQPEHVWPIFDATFQQLLSPAGSNTAPRFLFDISSKAGGGKKSVRADSGSLPATVPSPSMLVLFHRLGFSVAMDNGHYTSAEGVARVARMIVRALAERTDLHFVVTSRSSDLSAVLGFFQEVVADPRRVRVLIIDGGMSGRKKQQKSASWLRTTVSAARAVLRTTAKRFSASKTWLYLRTDASTIRLLYPAFVVAAGLLLSLRTVGGVIRRFYLRLRRRYRQAIRKLNDLISSDYRYWKFSKQSQYIQKINKRQDIRFCLIPHYYLFPEVTALNIPTILYLPDHMPSIMAEGSFGDQSFNDKIGAMIAQKAKAIITNSAFSAEYMPHSPLKVDGSKLSVFPLPNLNISSEAQPHAERAEIRELQKDIEGRQFVFYPTQNRPNKRLQLLAQATAIAEQQISQETPQASPPLLETNQKDAAIDLVLTCPYDDRLQKLAGRVSVKFFTRIADSTLQHLYQSAACLCFTSIAEGNFPTQILESLIYRVPIVAVRMRLIVSELGERAEQLILVDQDDPVQLARGIVECLAHRDRVIERQEPLRSYVVERHSWRQFADSIEKIAKAI